MSTKVYGIDVSHHQGLIDWAAVKKAGVQFAILRAGFGREISQKDGCFEENYVACKAAGIPVGAYWYSYATDTAAARKEAATCLKAIEGKSFEYPVWFDQEYEPGIKALTDRQRVEIVKAFCNTLEDAGYYTGLYCSRDWLKNYLIPDQLKAYDVWGIYLDIPKLSIMKGEKSGLPADSTIAILEFNRALAALQTQDHALAISALNEAKGNGYNQNDIYKYLVYEYEQTQDTVNLIQTLQEGEKLFKNEMVEVKDEMGNTVMDENGQPKMQKENTYTLKLINLYIYSGKYDEAIATLDAILAEEPDKAEYWNVKGNLYESQKKYDQSIECFEKAIEIDPTYADALGNLGRIYFNLAVQKNNEISSITDNVKYAEAREKEVIPLFEKSRPYYEKAYELKPGEPDYKYALRNIYYNLNDAEKLKAIEGQ